MGLKANLIQQQTLKLNLSANMVQAITLLQYNSYELKSLIEEISLENPLIEVETKEYNLPSYTSSRKKRSDKENREEIYSKYEPIKLYDYLKSQIMTSTLSKVEQKVIHYIFQNLNDSGYLEIDIQEIAQNLFVDEALVESMLKLVQSLDPPGIGARSLQECLLLQMKRMESIEPSYINIIENYFDDFANRRWKLISSKLKLSLMDIQKLSDLIQTLNPRPGLNWSKNESLYIVPDIIIEKVNNQWTVQLVEDYFLHVQMNESYYTNLLNEKDPNIKSYASEKNQQVQWLFQALEKRKQTMVKMVHAVLAKQELFFIGKKNSLKPMTMREIADEVGVNESTISRIVKNKYIRTPMGTYSLRSLFTADVSKENDVESISNDEVKNKIDQIILNENKRKPLSDQAIVEILKDQGIDIARRTVTKYREQLNIPSSTKRKRYE